MIRTQPRNRGFNLVELVVAIGILSFGIYGAAELLSASRHSATNSSRRIEATGLGNLKLQEFSAARANLAQVVQGPAGPNGVAYPAEGPRPFEQNAKYAWQARLQRSAQMPEKIDVTVSVLSAKPKPNEPPAAEVRGFVILPVAAAPAAGEGSVVQ